MANNLLSNFLNASVESLYEETLVTRQKFFSIDDDGIVRFEFKINTKEMTKEQASKFYKNVYQKYWGSARIFFDRFSDIFNPISAKNENGSVFNTYKVDKKNLPVANQIVVKINEVMQMKLDKYHEEQAEKKAKKEAEQK